MPLLSDKNIDEVTPFTPNKNGETEVVKIRRKRKKTFSNTISVKLSDEEWNMLQELKGSPHFINVSRFIREAIRKYHYAKLKKLNEEIKENEETKQETKDSISE